MTDEEIRIAIAGACGLEVIHDPRGPIDTRPSPHTLKRKIYYTPTAADTRRRSWPKACVAPVVPRYTECLNAMHEAEKFLCFSNHIKFEEVLEEVQTREGHPFVTHATARQRAEAFLRTLNLWKD